METLIPNNAKVQHMAGIVPIAGRSLDFNMPWPDAMMPVGRDYLAVEKAVWECVSAGCSSVWIVCYLGTIPLLRKRIGDFISGGHALLKTEEKMSYTDKISIFYIPIHPKDRDRRDSLGWSVLYGANRAYCLCKMISKWVIPQKFFCSFPYGITDDNFLKANRAILKNPLKQTIFSYEGKTVMDGIYTSFTFNAEDFKRARDFVKRYAFNTWEAEDKRHIPFSHIKKTLDLKIEEIFQTLDKENCTILECPWYHNIGSWAEYNKFMGSDMSLIRRKEFFISRKRENI